MELHWAIPADKGTLPLHEEHFDIKKTVLMRSDMYSFSEDLPPPHKD